MNLFCVIPNEADATSFYRALQPVSQLRHLIPSLQIFHSSKSISMSSVAHMDVCFMQRPSQTEHLQLLEMLKYLRIKVWIDYDDNLFDVPSSNPAHNLYSSEKTQNIMKEIISRADVISVSTPHLALGLKKYVKDSTHIHVIPNAFNDYLFKEKPVFKEHNIAFWRGTQSHQQDLLAFSNDIRIASYNNPSWLFNFMGYHPFFLMDAMAGRAIHTPPVDLFKYFDVIQKTYPNICMVTLSKSDFNQAKSNIAWIEATYAGAVCIGPDWEEWKKPGIVNYSNVSSFAIKLDQLMNSKRDDLRKLHEQSWNYIDQNLRLSQINKLRVKLLNEVMG